MENIAKKKKKNEPSDRIECLAKTHALITLKDLNDNFESSLPCRLINPSKRELGKISKSILENINQHFIALTNAKSPLTLWNGLTILKKKRTVPSLSLILENFIHPLHKPFSIRLYCLRNNITAYPMINTAVISYYLATMKYGKRNIQKVALMSQWEVWTVQRGMRTCWHLHLMFYSETNQ